MITNQDGQKAKFCADCAGDIWDRMYDSQEKSD